MADTKVDSATEISAKVRNTEKETSIVGGFFHSFYFLPIFTSSRADTDGDPHGIVPKKNTTEKKNRKKRKPTETVLDHIKVINLESNLEVNQQILFLLS